MKNIRESLAQHPQAVKPIYVTDEVNELLNLYVGDLVLTQHNRIHPTVQGEIDFVWLPSPTIRLSVPDISELPQCDEAQLHIPGKSNGIDVLVTNVRISSNGTNSYKGIITNEVVIEESPQCHKVIFHVPNYRRYPGDVVRDAGANHAWLGRLSLTYSDWVINIDEVPNVKALMDSIKNEGGFAITHVGEILKKDHSPFMRQDVLPVLLGLRYFLSFGRGLWCGPILPCGQSAEAHTWKIWNTWHLSSWKTVDTWLPYDERKQSQFINKVFQGIMSKLDDPLWSDPVKIAIHWFVEANLTAGGVEGAIILAQAALELLGWMYFVEDSKTSTMSGNKFNSLNAEDKILQLLKSHHIPTDIPAEMSTLIQFALNQGISNGPQILVQLRNGMVHPKQAKRDYVFQIPRMARSELQQLGLWYLELLLLHMLDYDGMYYPRFLKDYPSNTVTKVPWA
jgi:hypothetical protein